MSIFDRIKHAIFGEAHAAPASESSSPSATSASAPAAAPGSSVSASPAPATPASSATTSAPAASQPASPTPAPTSSSAVSTTSVDVESILNAAVKKSGQKLDWRHSIVDLMKALGMDASLDERKELAQELGYSGDAHDSAKMNTFLHKALMKKLSENGGKVPADLLD